jgi:AraC family transcriptional regulator
MDGFGAEGHRTHSETGQQASPFRDLYAGRLTVEQSAMHAMDKYVTENMLSFPGGWVETRQISWSNPLASVCTTTDRCYMINLSLSGWTTGGSLKNLRAISRRDAESIGRMWLVPPEQTLRFSSIEGQTRSIRCMLDAELFESFLAEAPRWRGDESSLHAAINICSGQIEWLLRRMYRELRNPDFATPQVVETLAKQLTVEIIRTLNLRRDDATFHVGGLAPWRLRLIRQRLWSEEPLPSLEELSVLCDMSERHLSRAFRSETGQTIGKHIEAAMVDRANQMLSGGATVRQVALALGYATARGFASAFRRATGLLPSEVYAVGKTRNGARSRKTPLSADDTGALTS